MVEQKTTNESALDENADKTPLKKRWQRVKPTRRNIDRRQRAILRHARKFLVQRWDNLRASRREVIGWLLLVAALVTVGCLQTLLFARSQETTTVASGGTYAEGVVDKIATINPLYATTDSEQAASGLVYASLLRLDETGHLRPELAMSYVVSEDGKTYLIKLRNNVRWSDGEKFTADDVVFTVELMKNPSVSSPLFDRWRNIKVERIDDLEVAFTLRDMLASFPFMLDFGILPAHVLKDVNPADIKNTLANNPSKMVGTGAFSYHGKEVLKGDQTVFKFVANEHHFRGVPRLNTLTIRTYATSSDLLEGFRLDEVNAAVGLNVREATKSLDILSYANLIEIPSGDAVFALFNNSGEVTKDLAVREALRLGIDRSIVRAAVTPKSEKGLKLKIVPTLETPLTPGLIASVDELKQPDYNPQAAAEKLDAAGWKLNDSGKRAKDGRTLKLSVVTVKDTDYELAAKSLAEQWRGMGIEVELTAADPSNVQQNFLIPRAYDVLVYQFHLGADPDIYIYWTSSQANARGLNFANYQSKLADVTLNNARTQLDPSKRAVNYASFVKNYWLADATAIALYRPNYYYLTHNDVSGLSGTMPLLEKSTRFADVRDFTVNIGQFRTTP